MGQKRGLEVIQEMPEEAPGRLVTEACQIPESRNRPTVDCWMVAKSASLAPQNETMAKTIRFVDDEDEDDDDDDDDADDDAEDDDDDDDDGDDHDDAGENDDDDDGDDDDVDDDTHADNDDDDIDDDDNDDKLSETKVAKVVRNGCRPSTV